MSLFYLVTLKGQGHCLLGLLPPLVFILNKEIEDFCERKAWIHMEIKEFK